MLLCALGSRLRGNDASGERTLHHGLSPRGKGMPPARRGFRGQGGGASGRSDRRRWYRRQRGGLFSGRGAALSRPHRHRRARHELPRQQHGPLGRRGAAAVLHAREHRHVAVHPGDVPAPQDAVRGGCRCVLPRAGLSHPGQRGRCRRARRERGLAAVDGGRYCAHGRRRPDSALPVAVGRRRDGRRFRPDGRGLVRPAEPRRPVPQGGGGGRRRRPARRGRRHRRCRRPHRGRAAGQRRQARLRPPRQRRGCLGRCARGAGRRGAARRAAQALRLCHRLPGAAGGAPGGTAHRRSVGCVVPARRAAVSVRQVADARLGAAGGRP